jgi:hypothetical protein
MGYAKDMHAMRCRQCGDVRWSFMRLAIRRDVRCELCGGEMLPERRQPHRGPDSLRAERRGPTTVPESVPPDRHSPS